jgi:3-oxoacyl-[acyl-carrier-protein] synthase II
VVVTGVGLVCALGIGTEETWKNLLAGQSGIGPITQFDTNGFDCKIAGEIKNFDPFQWIEKKELKKMGRFIQVALAGADFAAKSSNWKREDSDLDEVGVYVSSGIGGFDIIGYCHGLLGIRTRHRRFLQNHRAWRGGGDDLRRHRSHHHADGRRRICGHESAFHAQ